MKKRSMVVCNSSSSSFYIIGECFKELHDETSSNIKEVYDKILKLIKDSSAHIVAISHGTGKSGDAAYQ